MGDKDAGTPRVFLIRHGETEWSKSGRFTGITELELTENGTKQVLGTGKILIGTGKLIDPTKLAHIFISPRRRAQKTYELLFNDIGKNIKVNTTNELAEWDYGNYEGLLTQEIRDRRKSQGLDQESPWDIWRDGCESGETPHQVTTRLDQLIQKIHVMQSPNMHGEAPADVVLIAHGHILRAITKRWLHYPLKFPLSMMLEPGGVGVLTYQHHSTNEPAFLLGMGFPFSECD